MNDDLFGWAGNILKVNLSNKSVKTEKMPKRVLQKFIGGRGVNIKLLYDDISPDTDPLGPNNTLIFSTGPLSGTPIGMGRTSITAKSPKGCIAEGGFGGHFAPELKYAGYDHVLVKGKSKEPVYLWINGEDVELRDATNLWGKTTWETDKMIKNELGRTDVQMAYVGPAAENDVHTCPIISNLHHSGGRNGVGRIMASKQLKAVAVKGYQGVQIARPELFEKTYQEILESIDIASACDPWIPLYALWGSVGDVRLYNFTGQIHSLNAQQLNFEEMKDKANGERFLEKYVKKGRASFACPWPACGKFFEIQEGDFAGTVGQNLWSGDLMVFTALVGSKSLEAAMKARTICNQYGLDLYHVAYSIAWAMECRQKGILNKSDTDNIDLRFGNTNAMLDMIEKIALREGFGDLLARGTRKASEIVGKGSEDFSMTIKGLELESLTQRNTYQYALGLATGESGPDHTKWLPPVPINPVLSSKKLLKEKLDIDLDKLLLDIDLHQAAETRNPEGKGKLMKWLGDTRAVIEALPTCAFIVKGKLSLDFTIWTRILQATTGEDFDYETVLKCGERIINTERAFIAREGFTREDDTIPRRMLEDPVPEMNVEPIKQEDMDKMLEDYYAARDWNTKTGIPKRRKLNELELGDIAKDLRKNRVI